jgi:hypothetical protein
VKSLIESLLSLAWLSHAPDRGAELETQAYLL